MNSQEELLIVVDEDDNILGYQSRSVCHSSNKLTHRLIGIIVINDKGEILLQKRSKTQDSWPNYYTISVSGHVLKGETYRKAGLRELKEELGIEIEIQKINKFLLFEKERSHMAMIFRGKYTDGVENLHVNQKEISNVKFFNIGDIKKMTSNLTPFALESLKRGGML